MKRNILITLTIFVLIGVFVVIALKIFQSQDKEDDVYIRLAVWRSTSPAHMTVPYVHYFILKNDRTLISYYGISRSHHDISRRNFMRSVYNKEAILLNEQDFLNIHEHIGIMTSVENNHQMWTKAVLSDFMNATLYYNGNVYGGSTVRSIYFHELINKIIELSPLVIH